MSLWDLKAGWYHAARSAPLIRNLLDREIANLRSLLDEADVHPEFILDIGSGSGSSWKAFGPGACGIGIDRSRGMLVRAGRRSSGFVSVAADASNLPFAGNSMPFISAIGLAEYIKAKDVLLDEIVRVLAPGGMASDHTPVPTSRQLSQEYAG